MKVHSRLQHLATAGDMGFRIAHFNWDKTNLGNPDLWPQSLLTTLGIMLESKFAMYLVWGSDYIQFYNDAYIEILSNKHPAALGTKSVKSWKEVWGTIHPLFQRVFQGESLRFENLPLTVLKNGTLTERHYTFCYSPVRLENGAVGGVLDTVIDTSEEIINKKALAESEEKFRTYLEDSPTAFISFAADWVINYMNPAAVEVLGIPRETVLNRDVWEAFPGLYGTIFEDTYREVMDKKKKLSFEGFYPDFDRWYEVTAYSLPRGMAVSFQDITVKKKLEAKLSDAIKVRDDFLSIASHELKTPLTSLKLQSQMILRENASIPVNKLKRYSALTNTQVSRLNRLVDDMLDVSRINSGRLSLHKEKTDFSKLLLEVLERQDSQFSNYSGGAPTLNIASGNYHGEWDILRVEQIINNLISNALKYGEGRPIEIELDSNRSHIFLTIKDHGLGISQDNFKIIFEKFERAKNYRAQGEGLGLGLFISNQIAKAHKGSITVESEVNKGSQFIVELPKES